MDDGDYKVTVCAEHEPDLMKRIALLNASVYRVLKAARLRRILTSDYQGGTIELLVRAPRISPEIVPGEVRVTISAWPG